MKQTFIKLIDIALFKSKLIALDNNVKLICMSGSPRSGTTFIAEVISDALNNCPIIWEPLQDDIIRKSDLKEMTLRPVLEDYDENRNLRSYIDIILKKNELNYYNTWFRNTKFQKKFIWGNKEYAVVKFVRGNGLLDVFKETTPKVRLVFGIVRNPYSVISSQIKHHEFKGHPAYSSKSRYLSNIMICMENIRQSLVRDLAITWSVDYLNATSSKEKIFFYEEILDNPHNFIDFLTSSGIKFYKKPSFNKISSTYKGNTLNTNFRKKYKEHLKEEDIHTINEVLKIFDIKYPK